MKTKEQKEFEYENLDHIQQETFETMREHNICHDMCLQISKRYSLVDIQKGLDGHNGKGMTFQQYFMFKVRLDELTSVDRAMFHLIDGKFSNEQGDEYLALQMVEDYDTELLEKLTSELEPTGIDIIELSKKVLEAVRPKIVEVEADPEIKPEYEPGNPPF